MLNDTEIFGYQETCQRDLCEKVNFIERLPFKAQEYSSQTFFLRFVS